MNVLDTLKRLTMRHRVKPEPITDRVPGAFPGLTHPLPPAVTDATRVQAQSAEQSTGQDATELLIAATAKPARPASRAPYMTHEEGRKLNARILAKIASAKTGYTTTDLAHVLQIDEHRLASRMAWLDKSGMVAWSGEMRFPRHRRTRVKCKVWHIANKGA